MSERQNRPDHNYIAQSYLQEVLVFLEILEALAVPRKKKKKDVCFKQYDVIRCTKGMTKI